MGVDGELARGRAFGLGLEIDFECGGLPPDPCPDRGPTVRIERSEQDLEASFPTGAERFWERRSADGELAGHYDTDPTAGYLLSTKEYDSFVIDPDARLVRCVPVEGADWRWQRFLIGQVLPFVAVLHGREVFHASVMLRRSTGVVFFGRSGAGKSSLAAMLALQGARYVTDDVMAIDGEAESDASSVRAHPGFGLTSLRHDLADRLDRDVLERLGRRVGTDEEAIRLAVDVVPEPIPIGCAYFLRRRDDREQVEIEACVPVDPRLLLANGYNFLLRGPDRMTRQLDVCSRLARSVPFFDLTIVPGTGPAEVAELVDAHLASITAAP